MVKRNFALFFAACAFAGCSSLSGPKAPLTYSAAMTFEPRAERVLIVSFDGLRADLVKDELMPQVMSVRGAGAYASVAEAVLPSITLVNHTSMLTGVSPAKHGIDWNTYVPEKGTVRVPTIFDLAKRSGLSTAMVAGKEKFLHLDHPGTIDHVEIETGSPMDVARAAAQLIRDHSPQVMFVHFRHADSEGHEHGWLSEDQLAAVRDEDNAFGWILAALKDKGLTGTTQIIVTADHGGHDKGHGSDSPEEMRIPWIATGAGVPSRGALEKKVTTFDTTATAASALRLAVPAEWSWDGKAVFL